MVRIGQQPLLSHILSGYHAVGIKEIAVVRGYAKQAVNLAGPFYVDNDDFAATGELHSLALGIKAREWGDSGLIVSYGDVLFRKYILQNLLDTDADLVIAVDTQWQDSVNRNRDVDYVHCSLPYSRDHYNRAVRLKRVSGDLEAAAIHGEWMGFLRISGAALPIVRAALDAILAVPENRLAKIPMLLNRLAEQHQEIRVIYTSGNWLDIDSLEDVVNASAF
jgi:phosphoenolpyruvate phosphomutase